MANDFTGKGLLVGAWLLLGGYVSSCSSLASKEAAIMVEREPETISRHLLEHASIKLAEMSQAEGALTTWFYRCSNVLAYEIRSESSLNQTVSVEIIVTGVNMHIGLNMDVFLRGDAPEELRAHENGHVKICQLIYQDGEAKARRAAQSVLGRKFSGAGSGRKQALENALNGASEAICSLYRAETVVLANKTSDAYDKITDNGRAKLSVEDAVEMAFKQRKE
ncbi:MAG: hypothetical protein C5B53_05175 [Candidatus Melainabacteria bacterium]|nr:MAG: hypothetical protein C5B53_05175 [Candidatus Melainabacteria bacterium]